MIFEFLTFCCLQIKLNHTQQHPTYHNINVKKIKLENSVLRYFTRDCQLICKGDFWNCSKYLLLHECQLKIFNQTFYFKIPSNLFKRPPL